MPELLHYEPNSKNNMTENIVYNTDIIESFDGSEQRIPLLREPRNLFSYYYTLYGNNLKKFNNFLFRNQSKEIYIPIWQEVTYLNTNILTGNTNVMFTFDYQRFQTGMFVVLMKKNDLSNNEIHLIDTVNFNTGTLTLGSGVTQDFEQDDIIMPISLGRLKGTVQKVFPKGSDEIAGFDVKFQKSISNENVIVDSNINYPVFRDLYVIDKQPNKTEIYNHEIQRKLLNLDLGYGKTITYDKSDQFFNLFNYQWTLTNKKEINDFKTFCNQVKGKLTDFWFPTFENDMESINTTYLSSDSYITIKHQDFFNTFEGRDINIMVNLKNGNKKFFSVSSMSDFGTNELLNFNESWGEEVSSEDIDSINLLWKCRFNNDEFLFVYLNKNMAKVSKNAFMQKFNETYIPPAP